MPRALWKGAISFGLVHIPVELYPAESRHGLDLDMLDKRDFSPVGYKRYNKETGKDIEWNDIVKGYEYEKGQYVVLSEEELKRANVEATQTIDIQAFVDAEDIPIIYYEQPYYLSPSRGGDKVYVLLRETLKRANKVGIAKVVIRTKQHIAALLPMDRAIVLNLLRYPDEIRSMSELNLPDAKSKTAAVSDKEIKMALSLLEDMTEFWQPEHYRDTYYDDVMALVDKKIRANQTKTVMEAEPGEAPRQSAKVVDLMDLLKKSIGQKGKKPARTIKEESSDEERTPAKVTKTAARKPAAKPSARPGAKTSTRTGRSAAR
ncbi:DNA end-binding protein Ku [Novimethylophilus kurashikiensis]|uniref:Non-homologous end joining protein Ku n=1 Tax=Novimethylophilus kurashikiensis TaxID=1825523 RepID=A0A2R5F9I7_9PROT|nr:Ku protein [Novimethylophilus kurashikiensis]GBG13583.1 DNA end-binding protein Ku [Novimethylophilus kurashikiensis]